MEYLGFDASWRVLICIGSGMTNLVEWLSGPATAVTALAHGVKPRAPPPASSPWGGGPPFAFAPLPVVLRVFSWAEGAVLQGLCRLVFPLAPIEGAQVLQRRRHGRWIGLGCPVPRAEHFRVGSRTVRVLVLVFLTFLSNLVINIKSNTKRLHWHSLAEIFYFNHTLFLFSKGPTL